MVSLLQRKRFITENAGILGEQTAQNILRIVKMAVEDNTQLGIIIEAHGTKHISIDLDKLADLNPEIITNIYNIIVARRNVLSQPL